MVDCFTKGVVVNIDGRDMDITELFAAALAEGITEDEIRAERLQRQARELGLLQAKPNRQLGTTVTRMAPGVFNHWEAVAGRGCWSDRSERESILKFAPELRCKQEKLMDLVGASVAFGKGYDRYAVQGQVLSREDRLTLV